MGALATSKSTHVSVVVPMTGYVLTSAFGWFILFQERGGGSGGAGAGAGTQSDDDSKLKYDVVENSVIDPVKEDWKWYMKIELLDS